MKPFIKANHSGEAAIMEQENLTVARQAAWESIVLVKNAGALPLTGRKVALLGPGASRTGKGGVDSSKETISSVITIL